MATINPIAPSDIEDRSFAIIEREFEDQTGLPPSALDDYRFQVVRRVIHATGDFSFARSLVFHEQAIGSAIASIRAGKDVYIDVSMGAAGISAALLKRFGGRVLCCINDSDVAETARREQKTRSETALEKIADRDIGIVAVGNAPTALVAAMAMIDSGRLSPSVVVGVPVGFVNAVESKQILSSKPYPFITNSGRKGGTPVAVAIVNALIRLAR